MAHPSLRGIEDALAIVREHQAETPLIRSEMLSRVLDADVWLKNETASPVASFKLRGALVDIVRARQTSQVTGVATSSTGNHGQGVAYAARLLGIPADVFLPIGANPLKAAAIEACGAALHSTGANEMEANLAARSFAEVNGRHFVDDGGSLDLMEGAGTAGLEIGRRLEKIDVLIVPVGDAALIGGCAVALKALQPRAEIIGVQAAGAPALTLSFRARRPIPHCVNTIADGLAAGNPAALAVEVLVSFVDDIVLVDDETILAAMRSLAEFGRILTEPAGAAALAGAAQLRARLRGKRVVLVVTGANVTMTLLERAARSPSLLARSKHLTPTPFCSV